MMVYVKQLLTKEKDTCVLCGEAIRRGTVFAISQYEVDGQRLWLPAHLYCMAQARGATKEKLNQLPDLTKGVTRDRPGMARQEAGHTRPLRPRV